MRTIKLEAVLKSDIKVLSITKIGNYKRVRLEVDGKVLTLKEGDECSSTLTGEFTNGSVRNS